LDGKARVHHTAHAPHTLIFAAALVIALTSIAQGTGVKKRRPRPDEFGNVVMNNFSEKNGMTPVVFSHWVHRAKYVPPVSRRHRLRHAGESDARARRRQPQGLLLRRATTGASRSTRSR
jgi:hypothetical protein